MYWLTSGSLLKKRNKWETAYTWRRIGPDRLSELPDEILVLILSLLTLKEAASTSILGRRWRFLWTSSKSLNFEDEKALFQFKTAEIAKPKYVDRVNYVLKSHQGQDIDFFKICFCLDKSHSHEIHRWIKFAIQKRAEKIELDLTDVYFSACSNIYSFPGVKKLSSWSNSTGLKPVTGFPPFSFLKSLKLVYVNVTEKVVKYLLDTCNSLEELRIVGSRCLRNVIVSDPPKLKYLEVYGCKPLKGFEISADNLVSLVYSGRKSKAFIRCVPQLTDLSIGGGYCKSFIYQTHQHSSYLSQLTKLKLFIPYEVVWNSDKVPLVYPAFCNLKELELILRCDRDTTNPFFGFTALINASPSLSRLVVQFQYLQREIKTCVISERAEEQRLASRHVHKHLKLIELIGFGGDQVQLDLAQHLLDIASALEKMTIDTRKPTAATIRHQRVYRKEDLKDPDAKDCARKLRDKNPPCTRFVVL